MQAFLESTENETTKAIANNIDFENMTFEVTSDLATEGTGFFAFLEGVGITSIALNGQEADALTREALEAKFDEVGIRNLETISFKNAEGTEVTFEII